METVFSLHKEEFGVSPEVVVEAPGSVLLMGNHIDSDGGIVLSAGISRSIMVSISVRDDNSLRFYSPDYGERKRTTIINNKYKKEDRWANYIKGILYKLDEMKYPLRGLDITVTGDIPQNTGLASSTAVVSAVITGINKIFDFDLTLSEMVKIVCYCEEMFLGGGKFAASSYGILGGKERCFTIADFFSYESESIPFDDDDAKLAVIISNVPQMSLASEMKEKKKDIAKAFSFVSMNKLIDSKGYDEVFQDLGPAPEQLRRRCMHIIDEVKRAEKSRDLLKKKKYAEFGKLMNRSHESLRDNFEISCPEIDWLVKRAQETDGVYGAKITGAGFGGSIVSLMKNSALDKYRKKLEEYERIFGFKAETIVCDPAKGARIVYSVC